MRQLAVWLRQSNGSCVFHVGAGISTSAGIRDFRGKHGVWTELQEKKSTRAEVISDNSTTKVEIDSKVDADGKSTNLQVIEQLPQPDSKVEQTIATKSTGAVSSERRINEMKPFDETEPTFTHMALKKLCESDLVRHIISQNVDGLFLKANLPRKYLSEMHGNFYLDECTKCRSRFIRGSASMTMRLTKSNVKCPRAKEDAAKCRGHLRDTILDWESPIPYNELRVATREGKRNLLHICIGTGMQLRPSKDMVCDPMTRDKDKKLVIINLQPTRLDQKANLVINYYADDVMRLLMDELDLEVERYDPSKDPTKDPQTIGSLWMK